MVAQSHAAHGRGIEVAAVGAVLGRVPRPAPLREDELGFDVAVKVVGVEGLIRDDEVGAWVNGPTRRGHASELQGSNRQQSDATGPPPSGHPATLDLPPIPLQRYLFLFLFVSCYSMHPLF